MHTNHSMLKLYMRCVLLALPFILIISLYIYKDPFMVIRHYKDYDHSKIMQNEGAIAWEKLKNQRAEYHYDSFIMGTSCTKAFSCDEWNKYIHGHPFRFFANSEGLGDLKLKLKALDGLKGQKICNLLIITERSFFENNNPRSGIMHIMPPDVTGKSWLCYQTEYLQSFMSPKFLWPYLRFCITGLIPSSSKDVFNEWTPNRQLSTNDAILYHDSVVELEGEKYRVERKLQENLRLAIEHEGKQVIGNMQLHSLKEIDILCKAHHTDVHWIIGPNAKKERFNHHDLWAMQQIFGKSSVHDYSADKRFDDYHYYLDGAHYNRKVGEIIMKDIYRTSK